MTVKRQIQFTHSDIEWEIRSIISSVRKNRFIWKNSIELKNSNMSRLKKQLHYKRKIIKFIAQMNLYYYICLHCFRLRLRRICWNICFFHSDGKTAMMFQSNYYLLWHIKTERTSKFNGISNGLVLYFDMNLTIIIIWYRVQIYSSTKESLVFSIIWFQLAGRFEVLLHQSLLNRNQIC